MINIMLVDDHDMFRDGLKLLVHNTQAMKVVGEARDGESAVIIARECNPDIILMDVKMPGIGGLEATRKLLRSTPHLKILVLTMIDDEPFPSHFLDTGASGYITKDLPFDELLNAIRTVHSGQRYLAPNIAHKLALRNLNGGDESPFDKLSKRETQIMIMITNKYSIATISEKLCLSSKTVNTYRYRLFAKLGINSDVELTHLAIRHGLLEIEQTT